MDPSYKRTLMTLLNCPGARDWWNIYSNAEIEQSCGMDTCENDLLPSVQQQEPIIPPEIQPSVGSSNMAVVDTNQQSSQVEMNTNSELESSNSVNLSNWEIVGANQQNGLVENNPSNSLLEIPNGSSNMAVGETSLVNSHVKKRPENLMSKISESDDLSTRAVGETSQLQSRGRKKHRNSVLEMPNGSSTIAVGETSQPNSIKKNLRSSTLKIQKSDDSSNMAVGETSQLNSSQVKKNLGSSLFKIPKSEGTSTIDVGETSQPNSSQVKKNLQRNSVKNIPELVVEAYKINANPMNPQVKKRLRSSQVELLQSSKKNPRNSELETPERPNSSKDSSKVKNNLTNSVFQENPLTYEIIVDVDDFEVEEITVDIVDNFVVIHGQREENLDDPALVSMMFTRKYRIPNYVDKNKIARYVVEDGMLKIVCPKKII